MNMRRKKERDRRDFEYEKRLHQLLISIYESSDDNPLNAGQLHIIMEHLKYALIVGYEAA
jgi:hypothetical protein